VLFPIPLMTVTALVAARALLNSHRVLGKLCWLPFALVVTVFMLGFFGLAYSLYPFVVMDRLTLWQAASSPDALKIILVGVAISVPAIAAYTVLAYRVFSGKARALTYA
jgi:cytochrome d ubiquinol oxidase subunit II